MAWNPDHSAGAGKPIIERPDNPLSLSTDELLAWREQRLRMFMSAEYIAEMHAFVYLAARRRFLKLYREHRKTKIGCRMSEIDFMRCMAPNAENAIYHMERVSTKDTFFNGSVRI